MHTCMRSYLSVCAHIWHMTYDIYCAHSIQNAITQSGCKGPHPSRSAIFCTFISLDLSCQMLFWRTAGMTQWSFYVVTPQPISGQPGGSLKMMSGNKPIAWRWARRSDFCPKFLCAVFFFCNQLGWWLFEFSAHVCVYLPPGKLSPSGNCHLNPVIADLSPLGPVTCSLTCHLTEFPKNSFFVGENWGDLIFDHKNAEIIFLCFWVILGDWKIHLFPTDLDPLGNGLHWGG